MPTSGSKEPDVGTFLYNKSGQIHGKLNIELEDIVAIGITLHLLMMMM